MSTFKIAIVGRPNVGKSALFNRVAAKKIAIVDEMEGVTRDRLYANAELFGKEFDIIDTGGIDERSEFLFKDEIIYQSKLAIEEADAIIMVVDARIGVTTLDEDLAKLLHRKDKPVYLAINKVDDPDHHENLSYPFLSLGITNITPVSALHGVNVAELFEKALTTYNDEREEKTDKQEIKISFIGRPNVGKSTLLNFLLDEKRSAVSPIAGTTRDAIDVKLDVGDTQFTLIDTAGIRRRNKEKEVVDKFAYIRMERAIERSDICVLVLDSREGMTAQEKRIATMIEAAGKGCLLLFNKWDLVKDFRVEHCLQALEKEASFVAHCPTMFASALTGKNMADLFTRLEKIFVALNTRISTGKLNQFVEKTMEKYHPPMITGKRLRVYYLTQVKTQPPTFTLFVNKKELMTDSYKRYLTNQFRAAFPFDGAPISIYLRPKKLRSQQPHKPDLLEAKERKKLDQYVGSHL